MLKSLERLTVQWRIQGGHTRPLCAPYLSPISCIFMQFLINIFLPNNRLVHPPPSRLGNCGSATVVCMLLLLLCLNELCAHALPIW